MWHWPALILAAYLLGSVSCSLLLTRALTGRDLRRLGSGNAGATNVLRSVGPWPALLVLAGDLGKGALAVLASRWSGAPGWVIGSVAVAVVVGHMWPIYHGFRGGKGVATIAGTMFVLAPLASLLGLLLFVLSVALTRYVAVGSVLAIGSFSAPRLGHWSLGLERAAAGLVAARGNGDRRGDRDQTPRERGADSTGYGMEAR